jgi:hypothetical protein
LPFGDYQECNFSLCIVLKYIGKSTKRLKATERVFGCMSFGWFLLTSETAKKEKKKRKETMTTRERERKRERMSCVCTQQLRPFGQEIRQESRGFSSLDPSKSSALYTT